MIPQKYKKMANVWSGTHVIVVSALRPKLSLGTWIIWELVMKLMNIRYVMIVGYR